MCRGLTLGAPNSPQVSPVYGGGSAVARQGQVQRHLRQHAHPVHDDPDERGVLDHDFGHRVQDQSAAAVEEHGGRITLPKMQIPPVGWLIQFADPEGNIAGAMRYEKP